MLVDIIEAERNGQKVDKKNIIIIEPSLIVRESVTSAMKDTGEFN
jgi:hypothetical protein